MDSFLRASQVHSSLLNKEWALHEPNTETLWHAEDNEESFVLGGTGKQIRSSHVKQDYDWKNHHFTYKWNNLGLRGPDPNYSAQKRMLMIGSSLSVGQGLPLEHTFTDILAKKLNYDYINLSDFYVMTDSIQRAVEISKEYKPNLVLICQTRHLFNSEMILRNLFKQIKNENKKEIIDTLWDVFLSEAQKQVYMFEQALINNCAEDAKIVWFGPNETNERKSKLGEMITYSETFKYSIGHRAIFDYKNTVIDLARDNKHPGIKSNLLIANFLEETVNDLFR